LAEIFLLLHLLSGLPSDFKKNLLIKLCFSKTSVTMLFPAAIVVALLAIVTTSSADTLCKTGDLSGCPAGSECYCLAGGAPTAPCVPQCGCAADNYGTCVVVE
jgi:hypothetical protein